MTHSLKELKEIWLNNKRRAKFIEELKEKDIKRES